MALDSKDYIDFDAEVFDDDIENPRAIELIVDPKLNDGVDVLCLYSGILNLEVVWRDRDQASGKVRGTASWSRGSLSAAVGTDERKWTSRHRGNGWTTFRGGVVTLSLAKVYNAQQAINTGWGIDAADLVCFEKVNGHDHLSIQALLSVRDRDAFIYRISYAVSVKGSTQK